MVVTPVDPSIALGLTQQFTATGTYSDGSTQNLTELGGLGVGRRRAWRRSMRRACGHFTGHGDDGDLPRPRGASAARPRSLSHPPSSPRSPSLRLTRASPTGRPSSSLPLAPTATAPARTSPASVNSDLVASPPPRAISGTGLACPAQAVGTTTITADLGSIGGEDHAHCLTLPSSPRSPSLRLSPSITLTGRPSSSPPPAPTATAPARTSPASVNWTSSITATATIAPDSGLASALAVGTTTITRNLGQHQRRDHAHCLTRHPLLRSPSLRLTPSIANGTTQQFTATGTYSDGSSQNLTASVNWESQNTAVATVDAAGLVTSLDRRARPSSAWPSARSATTPP